MLGEFRGSGHNPGLWCDGGCTGVVCLCAFKEEFETLVLGACDQLLAATPLFEIRLVGQPFRDDFLSDQWRLSPVALAPAPYR